MSWSDLLDAVAARLRPGVLGRIERAVTVDLPAQLNQMETRMAQREDDAYSNLTATIETVKEGWAAKDAHIRVLEEQLAAAGVDQETAVQAALDADSEFDAGKVEAADVALRDLVVPPAQVEPAPVEPGDGESPSPAV